MYTFLKNGNLSVPPQNKKGIQPKIKVTSLLYIQIICKYSKRYEGINALMQEDECEQKHLFIYS